MSNTIAPLPPYRLSLSCFATRQCILAVLYLTPPMETRRVFPTDTSRWSFHRPIPPNPPPPHHTHVEERAGVWEQGEKKKKKADTVIAVWVTYEKKPEKKGAVTKYIPRILVSGLQTDSLVYRYETVTTSSGQRTTSQPSQFVRSDPTICVGQLRNLVAATCSHKHCKLLHRLSGYLLFKVYNLQKHKTYVMWVKLPQH